MNEEQLRKLAEEWDNFSMDSKREDQWYTLEDCRQAFIDGAKYVLKVCSQNKKE